MAHAQIVQVLVSLLHVGLPNCLHVHNADTEYSCYLPTSRLCLVYYDELVAAHACCLCCSSVERTSRGIRTIGAIDFIISNYSIDSNLTLMTIH